MGKKWEQLIVESYSRYNILHLTSVCPQKCVFCSHQYNPPGTEVFAPGHLPLSMIKELIEFLDPSRVVRTGESVSRVIEGEPFCHPEFFPVLEMFRELYPETILEIVTGGDLLTAKKIKKIKKYQPLRLKVSLNLVDPFLRKKYLSSKSGEVEPILNQLKNEGISFSVTAVAMPGLTGWGSLMETVFLAAKYLPEDITVFKPAIAAGGPKSLKLTLPDEKKLEKQVNSIASQIDTPLLLEPPGLKDFAPEIAGVKKNSPAEKSGLEKGDIIVEVNGKKPRSRVEAHRELNTLREKRVRILRKGREFDLTLERDGLSSNGAIFYQDIDYEVIDEIKKLGEKEKLGVITSQGAYPLLKTGFDQTDIEVIPIANKTFGGTIYSVGLLGVEDVLNGIGSAINEKGLKKLVLPALMFDSRGRDLWGRTKIELEERIGISCIEKSC